MTTLINRPTLPIDTDVMNHVHVKWLYDVYKYVHSSRCIHGISMCPPSSKLVFFSNIVILTKILAMSNLVRHFELSPVE